MYSARAYVVLVLVLGICHCEAARRRPNKLGGPMKQLEARLEAMEEQMVAKAKADESDSCNKVRFLFHGDDHDHEGDHEGETNVHVHVHMKSDGDHHDHHAHEGHTHHAVCVLSSEGVQGEVHFTQEDDDEHLKFDVQLSHLATPNSSYMMHVHQNGDVSNGCSNAGGHFDSNPDDDVDEGDLGTFQSDGQANIMTMGTNDHLSLYGSHSVVGHAVILHDSSGDKMACCVVGWAPEDKDHDHGHHDDHDHSHADDHSHDHDDHDHSHHDHDHDHSHAH